MKSENPNKNTSGKNPQNNPSKAMDSKREVEKSKDKRTDEDFPGYPHYPAREDIMDQRNDYTREDIGVENLPNSRNLSGVNQRFLSEKNRGNAEETRNTRAEANEEEETPRSASTADVTEDDLAALRATDNELGKPQNTAEADVNTDLDIPGSELDDANEEIGEEDEENNYYSLGGDRQESNEEDPYSGPNRGGQ